MNMDVKNNLVKYFIATLFLFSSFSIFAQKKAQQKPQGKVNVIFDTDIGPDYDDVGAIAMLHTFADRKEAEIVGVMSCNLNHLTGPTISLFNTYFKRPDIPIGVPKGMGVSLPARQKWPELILAKYPHKYQSNDEMENAMTLYRKLLAKAEDNSIVLISVGFMTNLSDLLNSKKDKISSLSGRELVSKKVKKLVAMAGKFPEGREYNIHKDTTSAINVMNNWPTEIIFSGWEVGNEIKTGLGLIANKNLQNSPVKDAFAHAIPQSKTDSLGRMSWDQTAVLVGVKGYKPYFGLERGTMIMGNNGSNSWKPDAQGKHYYLTKLMEYDLLTKEIEKLMMR